MGFEDDGDGADHDPGTPSELDQRDQGEAASDRVGGDRWTITGLTGDGGVRALHVRSRRSVVLPADYVASSVELGYASTVHTAQGVSVDTMHGLATGTEGRQQLYTMLTRGRHANHVYLQVVGDGDPHSVIRPETIHPQTATDVLEQMLARDTAPTSATSLQQQLADPRVRLGEAVARYTDALSAAAEDLAGDLAVRALERQVDHALPGVPWCEAWPALRAHLLLIAADGHDPLNELRRAAAELPLAGAGDPAAVLDWRLDATGLRGSGPGPLPWIPAIPSRLREHPEWGPYLTARARLVTDLADTVHQQALTAGRTPAWLASTLSQPTGQTIADLTVCGGPRWRCRTPTCAPPVNASSPRPPPAGNDTSTAASRATASPRWPNGHRFSATSSPALPAMTSLRRSRPGSRNCRRPASALADCCTPLPLRETCRTTTPRPRCGGGSPATSPRPSPPPSTPTSRSPLRGPPRSPKPSAPNAPRNCRPAGGGPP